MCDVVLVAERVSTPRVGAAATISIDEFKRVDLHESIDSTIRLLSRYYGSGRIRLIREYGTLPAVNCYAGQLNQVWTNLLVNAAQAIKNQGEVKISTRIDGESAVISSG